MLTCSAKPVKREVSIRAEPRRTRSCRRSRGRNKRMTWRTRC